MTPKAHTHTRTHAHTHTHTHTHTHMHTLTTPFELNEFRPFSTAVGTLLKKEVMVKMFTGSVILSKCLVGLDPEVVCDVRLKSRMTGWL